MSCRGCEEERPINMTGNHIADDGLPTIPHTSALVVPHDLSVTHWTRRSRTGKCSCGAWEKSNGNTREIQAAHRVHVREVHSPLVSRAIDRLTKGGA